VRSGHNVDKGKVTASHYPQPMKFKVTFVKNKFPD